MNEIVRILEWYLTSGHLGNDAIILCVYLKLGMTVRVFKFEEYIRHLMIKDTIMSQSLSIFICRARLQF